MREGPPIPVLGLVCLAVLTAGVSFVQLPFLFCAGLWGICLLLTWPRSNRPAGTWLLFGCSILIWMQAQQRPDHRELRSGNLRLPARVQLLVEVVGDADPQLSRDGTVTDQFPVLARALRYHEEWERVASPVQLRVPAVDSDQLLPGSRWIVDGVLIRKQAAWTGLSRAHHVIRVEPSGLRFVSENPQSGWKLRERLCRRIEQMRLPDPAASGVLQALLLGRRGELDDAWMERFARTGLVHVFAVSGLHIGMLAGMLAAVLKFAGVPVHRWAWFAIPVLVVFTVMTGSRASAIRACMMASCFLIAPVCRRQPHAVASLAASALLILSWAPSQLIEIGFLYSFILVAGILACLSPLQRMLETPFHPDPWAPSDPVKDWWRTHVLFWCIGAASMSLLAFILSTPLTAIFFNLFSPVALLGNLLAVPLAFGILLFGFPALLIMTILPFEVTTIFMWPAAVLGDWLLHWVGFLERIPHGVQNVVTPRIWELVSFYLLLSGWVLFRRSRSFVVSAAVLLCLCSLTWRLQARQNHECILFDAGQGQMSLFRNGWHDPVLVDTGDAWGSFFRNRDLQREGIDRIPHVFLTHPDPKHLGGLQRLLEDFQVGRLYLPEGNRNHPTFAAVLESGVPVTWLTAGDFFMVSGWDVEVLHPGVDLPYRAADTRGLVLRISDGFSSALIMGGADERVERALLEAELDLSAAILLAAHPSTRPSCSGEFLQAVNPESVFFSGSGYQGISMHRNSAEAEVANQGIPLWRVPEKGSLRISLNRKRFKEE